MYIIGITGGTGAGKTSAIEALQAFGAMVLDCDEVYHELLISNIEMVKEIEANFANVTEDGKINRLKLGEIVWNDADALQKLNAITHKFVNDEIDRRINVFQKQGASIAAIDAIALIESGQGKRCDTIVGITAPQESRIQRIMKRDNISKEIAQARINAQKPESFYKENCDFILENTCDTKEEFEEKCIEFFKGIL
ncbi:MAG: dephospho-CoA kinase [Oscillospiraceae bacterium]|nr:dephospho-CoA kinase [Oscillospiraceae bacterium]